jgi:hypothetical protein
VNQAGLKPILQQTANSKQKTEMGVIVRSHAQFSITLAFMFVWAYYLPYLVS